MTWRRGVVIQRLEPVGKLRKSRVSRVTVEVLSLSTENIGSIRANDAAIQTPNNNVPIQVRLGQDMDKRRSMINCSSFICQGFNGPGKRLIVGCASRNQAFCASV